MSTTRRLLSLAFAVTSITFIACSTDEGAEPSCDNGTRDGDELGIDCGGATCKKCSGDPCAELTECKSGKCENGSCAAPEGKTCGVGTKATCNDGESCELDADCLSKTCRDAKCTTLPDGPPSATDKKLNNGETDVDCGGPNAPKCEDGKTCEASSDCASEYCHTDKKCTKPSPTDGVKNGSETDVDCGGTNAPKCAAGKACLADTDCNGACNYQKKCVDEPSCKPHLGGDTCGPGEVGDGNANHESCCKSLEVKGLPENLKPTAGKGKTVYLDKYEVTAGRLRAFVTAMTALNAANIKSWLTANKPPFWTDGWTQWLPSSATSESFPMPTNTVQGGGQGAIKNMGTDFQFGSELYTYAHGHNCYHGNNSYGFSTYWYPSNIMTQNFGGVARTLTQDQLDVKSANCMTNAMLSALCAWDGGMIATDEVLDFVTNTPSGQDPRNCGSRCAPLNQVINTADAGSGNSRPPSGALYYYPFNGSNSDDANRVAAPGRMTTDVVRINAGDEPWMDIHGNLNEMTLNTTNGASAGAFLLKYRGHGYNSVRAAVAGSPGLTVSTYPQWKSALGGGRCMRFK